MNNIIYEGFFITGNLDSKLEKDIQFKHITTEFIPKITHENLYGTEAIFELIGYGNDNKNEGYKVRLFKIDNDELENIYNKIEIPHITLSVSATGKPVDTAKLNFFPLAYPVKYKPYLISTKFGGFNGKEVILCN